MMKMKMFLKLVAVTALLAAAGCQTTQVDESALAAASKPIAPIAERRAVVGDVLVFRLQNGNDNRVETLSIDGDLVTHSGSGKCRWVRSRGTYRPNLEWADCGGSSGSQDSTLKSESIFPLEIGKTETWDYNGTNTNGNSWASTRNCKVEAAVAVTVPAGTFDTMHVRCEDRWWVREWFVREDGVTVQFARTRKVGEQSGNRFGKLVSFTPGDA